MRPFIGWAVRSWEWLTKMAPIRSSSGAGLRHRTCTRDVGWQLTTIGRARIDGTEGDQDFVPGLGQPCGVAVDASHLYWTDLKNVNRIGRADLDGTNVVPDFIEYGACGVAVDSEHIFWSTLATSIGKANLDGSMANDEFIAGLERPCGVALDGDRIYWAEDGGGGPGSVGVAGQDGTAVNRSLVTDLRTPCGVAVDSTSSSPVYPDPRPASFSAGFATTIRRALRSSRFISLRLAEQN